MSRDNQPQRERHSLVNLNMYGMEENPLPILNGTNSKELADLSNMALDTDTLQLYLEINSQNEGGPDDDKCNHKSSEPPLFPTFHKNIKTLFLHNNNLLYLPMNIAHYIHLKVLDLSHNSLTVIPSGIVFLRHLNALVVRNNNLFNDSLPKEFGTFQYLEILNLSGNGFTHIPHQIFELTSLKSLYMGGNQIEHVSKSIARLQNLELLYLGGNQLTEIPAEMGQLRNLRGLVLCENKLQSLPSTISCLHRLCSLALHRNQLTTLPPEIVGLRGLFELSLRDNPLVVRFVKELIYNPPSLLELSARAVKVSRIRYDPADMPAVLREYMSSAQRCVNPRCKGVYFDTRVEHIKFVDFCGKYRLPLLEYLCSPSCSDRPAVAASDDSSDDDDVPFNRLRRVLLG